MAVTILTIMTIVNRKGEVEGKRGQIFFSDKDEKR